MNPVPRTCRIAPSLLSADFARLGEEVRAVQAAGADVQGERVRFDPAMIEELMSSVPAEFTFHARNPENSQRIGGNNMVFGTVASPPNSSALFDLLREA